MFQVMNIWATPLNGSMRAVTGFSLIQPAKINVQTVAQNGNII